MQKEKNQKLGLFIVLSCGVMWGLSGIMGQALFSISDISVACLSSIRMLLSGIVILSLLVIKKDSSIFLVWKNKKDILTLLIFSILGVMAVQYTYFAAISESNAATATVLQYTYPILILLYTAISAKKRPSSYEVIAIVFAFLGVALIATHGNIHSLSISKIALFWGLLSAFSFVFYTVFPQELYQRISITPIMGWAFLIAGFILLITTKSYHASVRFTAPVIGLTLAISFVGTLIPFLIYSTGVQILGNVKASLFVTVEPIFSALMAFFFLGVSFTKIDIVGFICILSAIWLAAFKTLKKETTEKCL